MSLQKSMLQHSSLTLEILKKLVDVEISSRVLIDVKMLEDYGYFTESDVAKYLDQELNVELIEALKDIDWDELDSLKDFIGELVDDKIELLKQGLEDFKTELKREIIYASVTDLNNKIEELQQRLIKLETKASFWDKIKSWFGW